MATTVEYINVGDVKVPLIFESDKRLPLATMQFVFTNSGSITDTKKAGLAKFSAKVLNEGTLKDGSTAFADSLESKAIHISASTGVETFVMEVGSLTENFSKAIGRFSTLLQDPNYSESTLKKIKTMTLGSLSRKENDFDYVASNELKSMLFKGSVFAHPSSGTKESIDSIEIGDVKKFIKAHLVQSRLIVVIGGDVDIQKIKKEIAKVIKLLPKGKSEKLLHVESSKTTKTNIIKKDTQQAYIYFGSPYDMKSGDKDYYKARVATFILGTGGFGSRMMEEIRVKKGLAYSAYARVSISKSRSYFSGYLQTKLESQDDAIKTVNSLIAKFVKDGATEDELEQTKKFLLGSEPLRVETMSQRLNRAFMEFYKGQEIGESKEELKLIQNLKLKDLNSFIKSHKEITKLCYAIVTK